MSAPRPAVLAAQGLAWHPRGVPVLGPLDLAVEAGECLAILGPNGAGKSTLLRLLAGLLEATAGQRLLDGHPYAELSRRALARRIAYVPQVRPARVPLSVRELVLQGRYPHRSPLAWALSAADYEAVERALERTGTSRLAERPLDELSGGERQAVYIAAALAQESAVLILDEPTTFLDAAHQRDVCSLLLRLHREGGQTIVLATHDLNFASTLADRVAALACGQLMACDRPAVLLEPDLLGRLFEAPFEVVRPGERPVTLLRLEP
jgi:ABC-type cobalamin/Fe3+-siderophores transport system ATPase subunit